MSIKRFLVVPRGWTELELQKMDRSDKKVMHFTYQQVQELLFRNAVEWMDESRKILRFTE